MATAIVRNPKPEFFSTVRIFRTLKTLNYLLNLNNDNKYHSLLYCLEIDKI